MKQGSSTATTMVLKMLLIGDTNVGKSNLLLRYVDDQFSVSFMTTIGIDFKLKKDVLCPKSGKRVHLQIWDTAGQERFRTITAAYYRGTMAVIMVYDVTNKQSFSHLAYWVSQVDERTADCTEGPPLRIIVGNKCDLTETRLVTHEEGRIFAESQGCLFFETSACTGEGVTQLFEKVAQMILEQREQQQQQQQQQSAEGGGLIEVTSAIEQTDNKKSCC